MSLRKPWQSHYDARLRSVPGIADQGLARTEEDHQHDAQNAHDRKDRLIQHHLDHAVPEPGHVGLDPGPKRLLAGLVNVVPELAEPGEPQGLVGDPAGAVIDYENESASQQQQPDQSEKTANHVSPRYFERPANAVSQYRGGRGNSITSAPYRPSRAPLFRSFPARKALTLAGTPSIRPANGGGRNPAAAVL